MLNILVTDKKMNSTPSLEHIALTKIVITLWNAKDIRVLVSKFDFPFSPSERNMKWQKIENKVTEKVPKLLLPDFLKMKLLNFIGPIGVQILRWMQFHVKNRYLSINLPDELCWTSQGTVDDKKTAEMLIKDGSLDSSRCYRLACIYCPESDTEMLWNKIQEHRKNTTEQKLVLMIYDLVGISPMLHKKSTPYQYAFECAQLDGNEEAAKYFSQKLTPKERKESYARIWEGDSDNFYSMID